MTKKFASALILGIGISVSGCEHIALDCPKWVQDTLPIMPSRGDVLTRGTQDQIVTTNEAYQANCK